TFNIFANSVQAFAREMSADLIRTAYSTVIREVADCSACLIDGTGRVLAQAENVPLHLNSVSTAIQGALSGICARDLSEDNDINAQLTANETGRRRFNELIKRYSAETVRAAGERLLDYAEAFMREAIREVPDGVYAGLDRIDSDGLGNENLEVRVSVEVEGDR